MSKDNIWSSILPIIGGIAGTILFPGVGTALGIGAGAMAGSGIGSLLGGAIDNLSRSDSDDASSASKYTDVQGKPAEPPMQRKVTGMPAGYVPGYNPEHQFFSHFDGGGPVLPTPVYNPPINPNGIGAMAQYFPNYTPSTGPDWQAIAASVPQLPAPTKYVPSQTAAPFDPMTYGRYTPTPNNWFPNSTAMPPVPAPPTPAPVSNGPISFAAPGYNPNSTAMNSAWGTGYSGSYGSFGDFSGGPSTGYAGQGLGDPGGSYSDISGSDRGSTYAKGGRVSFAEGGEVYSEDSGDAVQVYQAAVAALRGTHPNPESAIAAFIKQFGQPALMRLRMEIAGDNAGKIGTGMSPDSTGMSDSVPATTESTRAARSSGSSRASTRTSSPAPRAQRCTGTSCRARCGCSSTRHRP